MSTGHQQAETVRVRVWTDCERAERPTGREQVAGDRERGVNGGAWWAVGTIDAVWMGRGSERRAKVGMESLPCDLKTYGGCDVTTASAQWPPAEALYS